MLVTARVRDVQVVDLVALRVIHPDRAERPTDILVELEDHLLGLDLDGCPRRGRGTEQLRVRPRRRSDRQEAGDRKREYQQALEGPAAARAHGRRASLLAVMLTMLPSPPASHRRASRVSRGPGAYRSAGGARTARAAGPARRTRRAPRSRRWAPWRHPRESRRVRRPPWPCERPPRSAPAS